MRAVIQRVSRASVSIAGRETALIGPGMLVLLACEPTVGPEDIDWLAKKLCLLRVFEDAEGAMNRSLIESNGDVLLVSQFTLFASTRKGTRPSWYRAAKPDLAKPLYLAFHAQMEALLGRPVPTGEFGADMQIELVNDGPVTLILDTKEKE